MRQPSLADYIAVMNNPRQWFRTLQGVEPVKDKSGEVIVCVGNSAAVFKVTVDSQPMMLRCFTKHSRRIRAIYHYLNTIASPLTADVRLLEDELFVVGITGEGEYYDVIVSRWIDGVTLESAVHRACLQDGKEALKGIIERFEVLALELLRQPWAHGDIKPANVMFDETGALHLIDFDAIYAAELGYTTAVEVGTRAFQHPSRCVQTYNRHLDDYPIVHMLAAMRLMAKSTEYYQKIIFQDILDPAQILSGSSPEYAKAKKIAAEQADVKLYRLLNAMLSPTIEIADIEQIISAPCFDAVLPACEGLSIARLGAVNHFVDEDLNVIINASAWDEVNNFSHSLAAVSKDGRWGYINRRGEVAIEPQFEMAASFRDSLALVRVQGRYGYIELCGRWAIEPRYDYATSFKGGVASVELHAKSLTIDKTGNIVGF